MLRRISIILIFIMVLSSIMPVYAYNNSSSDYKLHLASKEITQAIDQGILKGYPDGTIRLDNKITRAEFCSLVNNALNFTHTTDVEFTDVDKDAWYYSNIQKALAAGYIKWYKDGTIRPQSNISRQEVAAIVSRIK